MTGCQIRDLSIRSIHVAEEARRSGPARVIKSAGYEVDPLTQLHFVPSDVSSGSEMQPLFNDFIGTGKQRGRYGEAERVGSFKVDDCLERGRLVDG